MSEDLVDLLVVLYAPFAVWVMVSPQSFWRIFEAWRFANPQTLRPSAAGYEARRFVAAIVLAALMVLALSNVGTSNSG